MDLFRTLTGQRPSASSPGLDETEEVLADIDEPPEHPPADALPAFPRYMKAAPPTMVERRESLLTRQLHSENEHTDDDDKDVPPPPRALSTQSTWSTYSTTSTAELTSDDGRSVTSPAISPPLPPTDLPTTLALPEKTWTDHVQIVGQEVPMAKDTSAETSVEANLGRKRCISFACGGKTNKEKVKAATTTTTTTTPSPAREPAPTTLDDSRPASPPKRKCTLKFVCPSKTDAAPVTGLKSVSTTTVKRAASPPPPARRSTSQHQTESVKVHRGSDSTVTHASPRSVRRVPIVSSTSAVNGGKVTVARKLSNDSDDSSTEATRFHVFGASEDEPEEWVQESTCHRSRLTISDTLNKENVIRQACVEVEEEVIEEEGEDEDEDDARDAEADGLDRPDEDDEDGPEDDDESEGSDDGFHSDDEEGFAASDSEGEGSDNEWWRPGGPSTAATSVDHIDRMSIHRAAAAAAEDVMPTSSVGSVSSEPASPRAPRHHRFHRNARKARDTSPVDIQEPDAPNLPDSTDFVCGTLDEDRPLEQAYLNCIKTREAAKHKIRPQDIDPTFPTSDPEMDEEDDEDLEDPEESERDGLVHGDMDDVVDDDDAEAQTPIRRRPSPAPKRRSIARSPPPRARPHSPAPKRRAHPSPPPPLRKRGTDTSPPPRQLFGRSPVRRRSPASRKKPTSTPRGSPQGLPLINAVGPFCLAQRTHLTHTASLPRAPGVFLSRMHGPDEHDGDDTGATEAPKRGAIDIVKGLERKRQRRKEKLYQKACAKAAAKNEKVFRVKPGRGAERMRELGLELQRYHGKGEFILSA
nr:uncharacterized protein CFP56_63983 [Quercus suber]